MNRVTISLDETAHYPAAGDFSPACRAPEYPFAASEGEQPNAAYELVQRCLAEFGCDGARYGT